MDIEIKSGPQGHYYLPKILRDSWGTRLIITPNLKAGVLYPSNTNPQDVLKSLEVLMLDFQHRVEKQENLSNDKQL